MKLWVDCRDASMDWTEAEEARLRETLEKGLELEGVEGDPEISVSFVTGEEIRTLNATYRVMDRETYVFRFPLFEAE